MNIGAKYIRQRNSIILKGTIMICTKKKICGIGVALLLALSLGAFATTNAFAATGTTAVSLIADDSNISVTMPTDFTVKINGDGTFTAPTNVKFSNDSVFAVNVSGVSVASETNYPLVSESDFATSTDTNVLWTKITPATGTPIDLGVSPSPSGWTMTKNGTAGEALSLTFDGAIKNLDNVPTTATKVYTLTWTVAAGV